MEKLKENKKITTGGIIKIDNIEDSEEYLVIKAIINHEQININPSK